MLILMLIPAAAFAGARQEAGSTTQGGTTTTVASGEFGEAPMLAELVAAGKLPPVEDRLPIEPYVGADQIPASAFETGKVEIGRYGGIVRGDTPHNAWRIEAIGKWGIAYDPENIYPVFFKSYDVSPDGKVYTFVLREGMKWSDGVAVTTEDVRFWYEDVVLNPDLTASVKVQYRAGSRPDGKIMELEIVDSYTFRLKFAEAPYDLLAELSESWYANEVVIPKHFFMNVHPKYTSMDKIDEKALEFGFQKGEWTKLFGYLRGFNNIGSQPSINPWLVKENTPEQVVYERNPYFWKVDAAGNQLPYLDGWVWVITPNLEAMNMQVISGQIDLAHQIPSAASASLYQQYADEGGYEVVMLKDHFAAAEFFLNLTNEDPNWRAVVRDVRFRKALNYAVDRQRVIDVAYDGFAVAHQTYPYTCLNYDPDMANRLLDEMGLTKKDSEGFRLGPNGERFEIFIEHTTWYPEMNDVPQVLKSMFENVGIAVQTRVREGGLFWEIHNSNRLYAGNLWFHYPIHPYTWYDDPLGLRWAPLWHRWESTNGQDGEEPPEEYKELWDLHRKMKTSQDLAERKRLWEAMKANISENVYWIPLIEYAEKPTVQSKKLGNTVSSGYTNWNNYQLELVYWRE